MLPHLACRVFGTPLLIARAKLDVILSVLLPRMALNPNLHAIGRDSPLDIAGTVQPGGIAIAASTIDLTALDAMRTGIAVIPILGSLVKRTVGLQVESGLTSYASIADQIDGAVADSSVSGIVLDIDSPGGEASGVFELSRRIRAAVQQKPIWAVANDAAFSAAYAIASSAERLFITETAGVGSIGVIALHVDQSARDATDGLRYTAITAGEHKNDFSPHEPLSIQAHASLQAEVDRLYAIFTDQVAQMRGIKPQAVRGTQAALFFGEDAVKAGLADGVLSLDAAVADMKNHLLTNRLRSPLLSARAGTALARASPQSACDATPIQLLSTMETSMPQENTDPITHPAPEASAAVGAAAPAPPSPLAAAQAAPVAAATPESLANLISEARKEATNAAVQSLQQSVQAIAEMCLIAGCPDRAAQFIAAGKSEAEVRRTLIEARASASDALEIQSTLPAATGTGTGSTSPAASPQSSPIVAAVKRLNSKE
ncbi:MAG: S49 family peptidase [Rhodoferax sp.]